MDKTPQTDNFLELLLQQASQKGNQDGQFLELLVQALVRIQDELKNKKVEIVGAELLTIKGEKGEKGEKGDKGEIGPQGIKGDKGDTVIGPQGKEGPQGLTGEQGIPGKDGIDGKKGKDGKNGKDGKDAILKSDEIIKAIKGKLSMSDLKDAPDFKPQPKWLGSGYTKDLSDWGQFISDLKEGKISLGTKKPEMITVVAGTTSYTVSAKPEYITQNGTTYYEDNGWTYDSTTKQITLDLTPIASDIVVVHFV